MRRHCLRGEFFRLNLQASADQRGEYKQQGNNSCGNCPGMGTDWFTGDHRDTLITIDDGSAKKYSLLFLPVVIQLQVYDRKEPKIPEMAHEPGFR